jgi:hypothetical protein
MNFIILDWCGNHCFQEQEFHSFDDAWSFIYNYYSHLSEEEAEIYFENYEVLERIK